jgi:hypothetical protein
MWVDLLCSFGERIEQAPSIALFKALVIRFTPLVDYLRDLTVGDGIGIYGLDDKIVGLKICDPAILVGRYTLIDATKVVIELAYRCLCHVMEVTLGEPRVLALEFDLTIEGQVVTDEDSATSDKLLGNCFWREGFEAAFGPDRMGEKGGCGGKRG